MKSTELFIYPQPRKTSLQPGKLKVPALPGVAGLDAAAVDAVFGNAATAVEAPFAWAVCEIGETRKGGSEAYKLVVAKDKALISAPSRLGAMHALRSLKQLMRQFGSALPCLTVEDWPEFPIRGAMLDISRDRVPTMGTLFAMVDSLSEMKLNHLQLYVEHSFAYAGHEEVWRDASPITPDEMRALDAYCAARGVELCANQNCLGHMERWLKHGRYAHLGEMAAPYFSDVWGGFYAEPNTIDPSNPASLALLRDLLGQIAPCCSGKYVNIGCDEPIDLGWGRCKELCQKRGKLNVYGEHVSKVASIVNDLGRRPQFWADPDFGNKRSELPELPKDLIGLVWGYEAEMDFTPRTTCIVEAGLETWVAPGSNGWNSFTGRTRVRRSNLERAAATRKLGAVGFLNTEWGDNGHRQQWPISLLGLAEGAYISWTGKAPLSAKAAGLHLFGSEEMGSWIEKLGLADDLIKTGNANASFRDSLFGFFNPDGPGSLKEWKEVQTNLKALEKSAPQGESLFAKECRHALACASWAADRAALRREKKPEREQRVALVKRVVQIAEDHKALWLARSRPGGLTDSVERYKFHMRNW
jgi:hypothetical protein